MKCLQQSRNNEQRPEPRKSRGYQEAPTTEPHASCPLVASFSELLSIICSIPHLRGLFKEEARVLRLFFVYFYCLFTLRVFQL